ncbi:MAG: TonB-dependent receptor [Bacteroidetes bacterium]|nr:TonB-dependent receptor [Bacteroidota bacterium]
MKSTHYPSSKFIRGLALMLAAGATLSASAQSDSSSSRRRLQEVSVTATKECVKRESEQVARLPISNLENPQVYHVVSSQLMQEQLITGFDDALKNVPGLTKLWTSTGRAGDGAGYFSMRGFAVQPSMVNGMAGISNGGLDPANIEAIETIKGPSGTLFGSSLISFGGLINIVTKKPYEDFGGELNYTAGSYGLNRITADVNAPLNKAKTALLRMNAAYHYEGSFQDAGFHRAFYLAPSFSYKANERLSFLVNLEYLSNETTNPLSVFLNRSRPLFARTPDELGIDFNRSFTSNDLTINTPTLNLYGQANYRISSVWTSQTNVARSLRGTDGYYSYLMFTDAGGVRNDTLFTRSISNQHATTSTTQVQQNFIGDFKVLGMRNRVVVGVDFLEIKAENNNSPYVSDLVSAIRRNDPRYGLYDRQTVDARIAASTAARTRNASTSYTYGAYVSNVLNITPTTLAMVSLRLDKFDNRGMTNFNNGITSGVYEQTTLSPKLGLVQQVMKDRLAVFANYMNGFKNVAPVTQPLPELNTTFKPQQANQIEAGVKLDGMGHRLSVTASYYNILVSNMTRPATLVRDDTSYNYTVQNGSQRSSGAELDVVARPLRGMNVILGYSYNDSRMEAADKNVEGRRPVSAGPVHLANFWLSYTLPTGVAKGLGFGFGGNYASENMITNDLRTGAFTLPAYTVFGATAFYETGRYRLALKLDNLSNEVYYAGWTTVERQMPRRLSASVGFRF